MEQQPERREPPPLEVDLTKTEGYPTGRAGLEVALRLIGLKVSGRAALPSPVMLSVVGVLATVAIVVGTVFGAQYTTHELEFMIIGGIAAALCLGTTTALAVYLIKTGRHNRDDTGGT